LLYDFKKASSLYGIVINNFYFTAMALQILQGFFVKVIIFFISIEFKSKKWKKK